MKQSEVVTKVIAFENGELNAEEILLLFRYLVETGLINQLQGTYQRVARLLIANGNIELPVNVKGVENEIL